jgi:hypothetical protein
MVSFFSPHTNLGVGKHHVLGNKIWRTVGDAHLFFFRSFLFYKMAKLRNSTPNFSQVAGATLTQPIFKNWFLEMVGCYRNHF